MTILVENVKLWRFARTAGVVRMTRRLRELTAENLHLRQANGRLRRTVDRQARMISQLQHQVQRLQEQFEILQREHKRQAAPFSKGPPQPEPKTPGRKPGAAYGSKARRRVPHAAQITETYAVPLPDTCPHCGEADLKATDQAEQYQVEVPTEPIYRQFNIQIGHCPACRKRVQGHHPLQTSDALGAARSQWGPRLQALLVVLQKQLGVSYGKSVSLLHTLWRIRLSRGGVVQSVQRLARKVAPTAARIRTAIRAAPQVTVDETGWRIGGRNAWLHVQATDQAVSYSIDSSRSAEVTARVLGWNYAGVLVHDGFQSYDSFAEARHQQCLAHLLRRCRQMIETASKAAAAFPRAVKAWLQEALAQRERVRAGEQSRNYLDVWASLHEQRLANLLRAPKRAQPNRRLARFLRRCRSALLTFLRSFGTDATNWRAEQALRPAVVNRKVWGGNRTHAGSVVHSTLMTVLATLQRLNRPLIDRLAQTLCSGHLRLHLAA